MLPVERVREDVLNALARDRRVVLSAPTGSGKSTRVPVWLAESFEGQTIVVEPRRVACRSLAIFLAREAGTELGQDVGYAVRFEDRGSANARIVFVTTGIALRWLESGRLATAGSLVLDEFHERRWETDLLLAVVTVRFPDLPVVVTSATLDEERVADTIGAAVVRAEGRSFPVEIRNESEPRTPTTGDLETRVADAVAKLPADGDVLVFLPGKGEIRSCASAICRRMLDVDVVAVHAGLPQSELARAFQPAAHRRVYLATNVAETSVTLPGVTSVVDSGLARRRVHRCGRSVLALEPISAASADQRAGRAGRVRAGRCVRLWSARFRPAPFDKPEVERIDLDEVVLRAAASGLWAAELANAAWVTPLPDFALKAATERLIGIGALAADGQPSAAASKWLNLPVGVHEARLIGDCPSSVLPDVVDLVACVDGGRQLFLPLDSLGAEADRVAEARKELFDGAQDEPTRLVRALRRGSATEHGLRVDALREIRRVAKSLRELCGSAASDGVFRTREVALVVAASWPRSVFVARSRALRRRSDGKADPRGEAWGNGEVELRIRSVPLVGRTSARAGVVLDQAWLEDGATGARGVGGMLLPLRLADLDGLRLGTVSVAAPRVKRGGRSVAGVVRREFAGVLVSESEEELHGAALIEALPQLVLRGSLMKGVASDLLDALHTWEVSSRSEGSDPASAPPSAEDWLALRFTELGVAEAGDLELIETVDLMPDVGGLTGLPSWEVDSLAQSFPRQWQHDGVTYSADVYPRRHLVRLVLVRKETKRAKDPPLKALPRFAGFRVELVDGSRIVRLR